MSLAKLTEEEQFHRLKIQAFVAKWLEETCDYPRAIVALPEPDPDDALRQHDYYLVRWWRNADHLNGQPNTSSTMRVCASDIDRLFIDLTFDQDGYPLCPSCQFRIDHFAYTEPPFYTPYSVVITKEGIKLVKGRKEYLDDGGCRYECPNCQLDLTDQVEMMGWTDTEEEDDD